MVHPEDIEGNGIVLGNEPLRLRIDISNLIHLCVLVFIWGCVSEISLAASSCCRS